METVVGPVLERIGADWEHGRIALSQVYMSGRICEDIVNSLLPPAGVHRKDQPTMAIAVLEDHHGLGKRIVSSTLRASGFVLADYGHGVTAPTLARKAADEGIEVLLISTLMLRSAHRVFDVRTKLDQLGCKVKIVVGGAPFLFDSRLWQEVGADAMGKSASDAVSIVTQIAAHT